MFTNRHILVVDDSPTICDYLKAILSQQNASVDVACSGQAGLDTYAAGVPYDLILLDLLMPDMNGIEVLQRIRQQDDRVAIVILTGVGGVKSAITAVQHGADAYVEKQEILADIYLTELFYILDQALKRRAGVVAQKQLQQVRAEFYSMVTHDLRNPASFIKTSSEALLSGDFGPLSPEQESLIEIMHRSAQKMLRLINDYLDFSRMDAGYLRLNCSDVDLRQVAEDAAQFARPQIRFKSQTLTLEVPPMPVMAHADAERLHQALDNLLSNAIKYTPKGGAITLQLELEDGQAVFRVSDTGNGIPPDQIPTLFARYHRVLSDATVDVPGTGLGLLIVKEIIEAHGGAVHVESEGKPGRGTIFTAVIPLAKDAK